MKAEVRIVVEAICPHTSSNIFCLPSEINFFVHFEKSKGECNGELKGKARFISSTVAQYYEPGNPCTIQLSFSNARVTMKETRGCGSYRDIKCYFEGSYPKKKEKKK